jgi:hypothetical protein
MNKHEVIPWLDATLRFPVLVEMTENFYDYQYPKMVLVFEGNTSLPSLDDALIRLHTGDRGFMVVNGDLNVADQIQLYGDDRDASGLLVLGSLTVERLLPGCVEILITGDLVVRRFIYAQSPYYEGGVLEAKGKTMVPFVVLEDYNPCIKLNLTDSRYTTKLETDSYCELKSNIQTAKVLKFQREKNNKAIKKIDNYEEYEQDLINVDDDKRVQFESYIQHIHLFNDAGDLNSIDDLITFLSNEKIKPKI